MSSSEQWTLQFSLIMNDVFEAGLRFDPAGSPFCDDGGGTRQLASAGVSFAVLRSLSYGRTLQALWLHFQHWKNNDENICAQMFNVYMRDSLKNI